MNEELKDQIIDLNFKLHLVQNAIGLNIDEEDYVKNNPDMNIMELKELTRKLVSSYLINNPYKKDLEEATMEALRNESQNIQIKKNELLNEVNQNVLNSFSVGKTSLDEAIETINFNNQENKISASIYTKFLLASKNKQEYNAIMNHGLRNSLKENFENDILSHFFQMKNVNHYDRGINSEGLRNFIEGIKNYYSSTQNGISDFLKIINQKDLTGEFIINNQNIKTMFLRNTVDFNLIENNEENKNNFKSAIKNIIVKNIKTIRENEYSEDSKVLTGLNIALIKGLENSGASKLISSNDIDVIIKTIGEENKDSAIKTLELEKLSFELKKTLLENRKNLDFKEKYHYHKEGLTKSLRGKELVEAVLDFIDYDMLDIKGEVFRKNLVLMKSEDAVEKIKSVFPNISDSSPSQNEIEKVQENMLKEYAMHQIMEKNILAELKKEINEKIDEDLSKGISIKDQNIIKDMNSLFKQEIVYFSLRALPLLKIKEEQEFKECFSDLRLENKKELYDNILKDLLLENEFYKSRVEFGYVDSQIPKYINDFNKKEHYYVSNYILSKNKISDLIIDNFDNFDKIIPETLNKDMLKKVVNSIISKTMMEAVVELKDYKNENKSYKLLKISKALSEMADCQKTLSMIDKNIKGDLEGTLFYNTFKTLLKDENKNTLKFR